jgi:hypothetical protein
VGDRGEERSSDSVREEGRQDGRREEGKWRIEKEAKRRNRKGMENDEVETYVLTA